MAKHGSTEARKHDEARRKYGSTVKHRSTMKQGGSTVKQEARRKHRITEAQWQGGTESWKRMEAQKQAWKHRSMAKHGSTV